MLIFQNKIIRSTLAGAVGGFLAWVLSEPIALMTFASRPITSVGEMLLTDALWALPIGFALGGVLGAAEGISLRSLYVAVRGGIIGMGIGLVGGTIGVVIAEIVFQQIKWLFCFGRGIGWSIFGLFLGASEGIRRMSLIGVRNAALGGAIGGFIGGVVFDLVGSVIGFIGGGTFSRAIALTILGACIGILIALVERALAQGALRVIAGRQEGREILLDKPRVVIGRDERNDVYMSDRGIEKRHAEVRAERGGHAINALSGAVAVNGNPVTRHLLRSGDEVQLGDARLRYRTRGEGMPLSRRLPHPAPQQKQIASPAPREAIQPRAVGASPCPRCAHSNRAGAKFCARCGHKF